MNDEKRVRISADQGYGAVDPEAFNQIDLDAIPAEARHVGAMLVAEDPEGNQRPVRVHEIRADGVVLDFNHPLAGQPLQFSRGRVRVARVRQAAGLLFVRGSNLTVTVLGVDLSFSIATPTGEGVTTPLTFTRERRCTLIDDLRILGK